MKLYKVIIALISLLVLSEVALAGSNKPTDTNGTIGSMPTPTLLGDDLKYSMPAYLFRYTQFMRFRLNKEEKAMHQSAVFFMLQDVPNGKIVSWYSKKRLANGKVRVIHSYPISGGYCRTYQAYIKLNGKEKHTTNNACKYMGSPSWSFYN
tara:strand:- start:3364 stop:3816 length:453 start_codon:yes stop_codon:yes gene_type:complete